MHLEFSVKFSRSGFNLDLSGDINISSGIFGPSGAGKSTLLKMLAGQQKPDSGRVVLNGRVLFDSAGGINVSANKRNIGMVFQDCRLFPHLSARHNITYGLGWFSRRKPAMPVNEVANALDITPLLDKMPQTLSGGEKQRVAIARALVAGPELLLLDEPFSALDRTVKAEIIGYLNLLHERMGVPYIIVSHELPDILQITPFLYMVNAGDCLGYGKYHDLALPVATGISGGQINVLPCVIEDVMADSSMVALRTCSTGAGRGGRLFASYEPGLKAGQTRYFSISPDHIAISLAPVEYTTMQNQFAAKITGIKEDRSGCYIMADCEGASFISEISRRALDEFDLAEGMQVWMLFKSRAFKAGALTTERELKSVSGRFMHTEKKPNKSRELISTGG